MCEEKQKSQSRTEFDRVEVISHQMLYTFKKEEEKSQSCATKKKKVKRIERYINISHGNAHRNSQMTNQMLWKSEFIRLNSFSTNLIFDQNSQNQNAIRLKL